MGVHDLAATHEAKKLLGIPEDEPVFILRAQDILYPAVIAAYEQLYVSASHAKLYAEEGVKDAKNLSIFTLEFADHIDACRRNGRDWQRRNPDKVKVPD